MHHAIAHRKFSRTTNQRKALLSNLANALIQQEHIKTTLPKAKDLRPLVEKLITVGKTKSFLTGYRQLNGFLRNAETCKKVMGALAERYKERPGGYLRIIKAGFRYGDNAPMAIIEFVDYQRPPSAQA